MTEAEQDAQWLRAWAERNGYPAPTPDDMDAFAERVAIKMADMPPRAEREWADGQVSTARYQAAREWEERHGHGYGHG